MTDDWRSWLEPVNSTVVEDATDQEGLVGDGDEDASSRLGKRFPRWWRLVAAAAVLMGVGAGVASIALLKLDSDMRAASVTLTATVTPESSPVTTSEVEDKRCPNQPAADVKTPEGVVVAFQKAYFAADQKKIVGLVTDDSYLREVEWVTSVGELKGSTWCAVTKKETDSTVAASVTVRTPTGEEQIYIQTYTVVKVKDVWRIVSITDREET